MKSSHKLSRAKSWSDFKRPFFRTQADHWLILSVCHSVTPWCSLRLGWCFCSEWIYYRVSQKSLQQILDPFWYFGHLLTILDTLHRFGHRFRPFWTLWILLDFGCFWTFWAFLDTFGKSNIFIVELFLEHSVSKYLMLILPMMLMLIFDWSGFQSLSSAETRLNFSW